MAQTHVNLLVHVVFSTKARFDFIKPEIEAELYAYIGGIVNKNESKLIAAGGTPNHVHLFLSMGKSVALPVLVGDVKRGSSAWLKKKGGILGKFRWQDGYSAFSVGHTQREDVIRYIANQKEHHRERLFEDEMRSFYTKYEIQFDERFLWD